MLTFGRHGKAPGVHVASGPGRWYFWGKYSEQRPDPKGNHPKNWFIAVFFSMRVRIIFTRMKGAYTLVIKHGNGKETAK